MQSQEQNHHHETNNELTEKVRVAHEEIGRRYGWHTVNANGTIEEVTAALWDIITRQLQI